MSQISNSADVSKCDRYYAYAPTGSIHQKQSNGASSRSLEQARQIYGLLSISVNHSPNMVLPWSHDQNENNEMFDINCVLNVTKIIKIGGYSICLFSIVYQRLVGGAEGPQL